MYILTNKLDFIPNTILFISPNTIELFISICIDKYPPKNKTLVNVHINTSAEYSARKKNTNITAECSVINPLTNSDSLKFFFYLF